MKKIYACYSSKGGVGKTASCVNLAYASAISGYGTLLIDLDQPGAASFYFRIRPPKNLKAKSIIWKPSKGAQAIRESDYDKLHILPAHTSYRNLDTLLNGMKRSKKRLLELIKEVNRNYDRIFVDAPPTLSLLAENLFFAADKILVPVIPTTLSERTYYQLREFFDHSEYKPRKLKPFFSMVEKRKRMHKETMDRMRLVEKRFLESTIPFSARVESMGESREPILKFAPRHEAGLAFKKLWQEIENL